MKYSIKNFRQDPPDDKTCLAFICETCRHSQGIAALISAAPEMYSLLDMILVSSARGEVELSNSFINALENVLNKARGEK